MLSTNGHETKRLDWLMLAIAACGPTLPAGDASTTSSSATITVGTSTPSSSSVSTTTASVSGTTSSSGTTTGQPADGTFLIAPDGLPTSQCDLFAQDCRRGEKCVPWAEDGGDAWNATRCVPIVDDPRTAGEPCTVVGNPWTGEDDCDGTSICFGVDPETLEGVCTSLCRDDEVSPSCPNACDVCPVVADGALNLCLARCDALAQDCRSGWTCQRVTGELVCVPDDSPPGAGIGGPCESITECPPGLVCADHASVPGCDASLGCCTSYCPLRGEDPCPVLLPGTICMPWVEDPPPMGCAGAPVGVCVLPS
jgi:hypothetical protein